MKIIENVRKHTHNNGDPSPFGTIQEQLVKEKTDAVVAGIKTIFLKEQKKAGDYDRSVVIFQNSEYFLSLEGEPIKETKQQMESLARLMSKIDNERIWQKNLLYGLYQILSISTSQQDADEIENFITGHFTEVKLVKYDDEGADISFFDIYEANISQPVTSRKAIVSKSDNGCIHKGIYLKPIKH